MVWCVGRSLAGGRSLDRFVVVPAESLDDLPRSIVRSIVGFDVNFCKLGAPLPDWSGPVLREGRPIRGRGVVWM